LYQVSKGKRKAGEKKFSTSKNEKDGKEENKVCYREYLTAE